MKKLIAAILFFMPVLFTTQTALAQATLRPEAGYMFSLNGSNLNIYQNSITGLQPTNPAIHSSWGKGLSLGLMFNYKFNQYLTFELGCRYHYGSDISLNDTIGGLTNNLSDRSQMFVFSLGYFYQFPAKGKFKPYISGGVLYAADDHISITETSNDEFDNNTIFNSTLSCSPSVGPYIEVGVKYQLSNRVYFFGELRFEELSLTPEKLVVSSVTQNNNNVMNTLLPFQVQTNYVTNSSTAPFSQLAPTQVTVQRIPASSWGFNLGLAFDFGSGASPKK